MGAYRNDRNDGGTSKNNSGGRGAVEVGQRHMTAQIDNMEHLPLAAGIGNLRGMLGIV